MIAEALGLCSCTYKKAIVYYSLCVSVPCNRSFMHPTIQVRELHRRACTIIMHGLKFCNMPIPCVSANFISLQSFICGCTLVI